MLKEKIQRELNESLKNGDNLKRLVLSSLLAAVINKEKEKRLKLSKQIKDLSELEKQSQLNDEEVLEVIFSEVKKRKEAKDQYEKGLRPELAQKEDQEFEILSVYLPVQMDKQELTEIIKKVIQETQAKDLKDMGKVIGQVMARVKGKADGSTVSSLVKKELSH